MSIPSPILKSLPTNKAKILFNATCAYCGRVFDGDHRWTKEHVIGRRFVPRGALDGEWNLILRACAPCNNGKAELENDISALTMQPDAAGRHPCEEPAFIAEALRRAEGAYSRKTKLKVKDSAEQFVLSTPFLGQGATATFTFDTAPQLDPERVFRLAVAHIQGFFYFLTYEQGDHAGLQHGGFAPGTFQLVMDAKRADWGNARLRSFAETTAAWDSRLHLITAKGFFRTVIRRHPGGAEVWSWGLEWNKSHRIVGFFGNPEEASRIIDSLSKVEVEQINDVDDSQMYFRLENPILEEEDSLFTNHSNEVEDIQESESSC